MGIKQAPGTVPGVAREERPAILGGPVDYPTPLPISQPTPPDLERTLAGIREVLTSHQLTNHARVREFEEKCAAYLGVEHTVAVSSCTAGLALTLHVLGVRGGVALASFTFPATAHAVAWNGLRPVFVDCEAGSLNLDAAALEALPADDIGAVIVTYVFGNAPRWPAILEVSRRRGWVTISDAAQALGTRVGERFAGTFADAEVFSLAPTKLVYAGEGGLVATADQRLAHELRAARNYGHHGNYDCHLKGLNARLSEIHAVVALETLRNLESAIERRARLVARYRERLSELPGITFQEFLPGVRSTHNYFVMFVDSSRFGLSARELHQALQADGIVTRRYFYPPVHRQTFYRAYAPPDEARLATTVAVSEQVLCLPLFSHMVEEAVETVCRQVRRLHQHAEAVRCATTGKA